MATNADAQIRVTADVSSATQGLKELEAAVKSVNEATGAFRNNKGGLSSSFSGMAKEIESTLKQYEALMKNYNDTIKKAGVKGTSDQIAATQELVALQEQAARASVQSGKQRQKIAQESVTAINKEITALERAAQMEKQFNTLHTQRQRNYEQSAASFDKYTQHYERQLAKQQQYENALSSREQITTNGFLRRIQNSAAYIAGYGAFSAVTTGLTSGLQAISDYEQGVTNLRRTLDSTGLTFSEFEASLSNFGSAAISDAKEFGVAISDAQEAMTELARAGVSSGDLQGMTESVLMGLNTTELETASDVTSALVSTIKQMNMSWSDSGMILDSWNYLADRYAVQTDDFAHAIERSGAASKMLGMDLYDLNAVVTILGESTQASGEQVGTAFRSLSARLLRDSTIDKLAKYGIQVKDTNGTFLEFGQIMSNINDVIKDLPDDSIVLSDIMDTLGGSWRKNWITALTQNFDDFDRLVAEQANSVGYSAEENAKAMDTIAKKAETLKQTFLEAFVDIGEAGGTDAIKDFLDGTAQALDSAINSPTIRGITDFLFGSPKSALLVGAGAGILTKLAGGLNPLQQIAQLVTQKIPNNPGTLGGFINNLYDSTGVSGKQNRASRLYNQLKDTYKLTDTEMVPIANRIDDIFQSNTTSIAQTRSEVDRLKSSMKDAETSARTLFSSEGQSAYRKNLADTFAITDFNVQTKYLEAEQRARMDNLVALEREYTNLNRKVQAVDSSSSRASERGLFASIESSRFKEGVRSFAGSLASGAVQMVAIAAAAKGIDYLVNWNSNQHEEFYEQLEGYEQSVANIKQQQTMVSELEDTFNARGALVSSKGENRGLGEEEFNSFNAQLSELKDLGPSVSAAIEKSARTLGNYGEAATAASKAIALMRQQEASAYLSESRDDYADNMKAWNNELKKKSSGWYGQLQKGGEYAKQLKKLGIQGDISEATGNIDVLSDEYALSNLEKLAENRSKVASILKSQGRDSEYIEDFFDQIAKDQDLINTAISDSQRQGTAELERNMLALQDAVDPGMYEDTIGSLSELIGSAQSVNQAQMLEGFTKNLARDKKAFADYSDAQADLAEQFSKQSVSDISGMIRDYAESAKDKGLVSDDSSLANAMFEQYFGFNEQEYQGMVKKMKSRIDSSGLDLSSAFGVDKLSDIKANQFEGIYDFVNELTYKMNEGNAAAQSLSEALNDNLINGINWEKADSGTFSNFFQLDTSQADAVINAISAMEQKAGSLGQTLSTAFGGDITAAFEQLSSVARGGAEDFASTMSTLFDSIDMVDPSAMANMIAEISSALNMPLTDEMLIPLGFKIENGSIVSALSEAEQAAQGAGDVNVPIKGKYDPASTQEATTKMEQEAQAANPNVNVGATAESGAGAEAGERIAQEAKSANPTVNVGATADDGAGTSAGDKIAQEAQSANPTVDVTADTSQAQAEMAGLGDNIKDPVIKPQLEFDFSSSTSIIEESMRFLGAEDISINVDSNADQVANELQGLSNQDVTINVKANVEEARSQIQSLLNSEDTAKLNVQAETSQAESQIQSLLSSEETAKLTVQADTSQARSEIQSLMNSDSTAQLRVQADTSQAESQIASLSRAERVEVNVDADTSRAQYEIESLGGYSSQVDVQVNADVSSAQSAISSLGNSVGNVQVPVSADTSQAVSQIQAIRSAVPDIRVNVTANTAPLQASLAGLQMQASGVQASLNGAAMAAASAGASITGILGSVAAAQAAILQLQALASTPLVFQADVSQLNAVAPAASAAAAAANAAMSTMQSQIQSTAAAFSAGCSQMVAAWAGMSFPAPYIPTPHITTTVGLGTYDVSIAWYAKGGIIPATPGGRIVGVGEGGEDEAIVPISKLQDYIKTSMSDVLEDAMGDYSDLMEKSWEKFRVDYNTSTATGYYATKVQMPLMELSEDTKKVLEEFTNKKIDISGYDPKHTSSVIDYITQDTTTYDRLIEEAQQQVDFYEAYGDSIQKAHAETDLLVRQWQQAVRVQTDAKELTEQLSYLESKAGEDLHQYLDANLELNYLYEKRIDAFGEGNDEAKEAFENQVKGFQEVIQTIEELQDKLSELNVKMTSAVTDLAEELITSNIENQYDAQRKEIEERLNLVERERDQYEKDIDEQRDRLEKARDEFEEGIDLKQDELQKQIDAIKDEQDRRENERKLQDLQDKIKDAQERLDGLNNDYNTRVYTMDEQGNWQWKWEANPKDLEEATEDLQEAQDDLKEYYEDQEIDRLEKEQDLLDEELDNYNDHYDKMVDALEEQQDLRLEAYDEEIEMLNLHLDEVENLRKQALDNVELMAKQLVDHLMSIFTGRITSVYDYLQIANGNYGVSSYNPLGAVFRTDYADQLYQSGTDLEEYTNKLLEITRNPSKYDPTSVYNANKELEKLGTTGAVDLTSRIEVTPALLKALGDQGLSGLNEYIYSLLGRIGSIRQADSGTGDPSRGEGTVVTAAHVADYLRQLGINTDAIQVAELASNLIHNELDSFGNVMNSVADRFENYGSNYDFGESGQGILKDEIWDNLEDAILGFDGTAKDIYDVTGKLITNDEKNLALGDNVIHNLINNSDFLSSLIGQNKDYYDKISNYFVDLIGKMDANDYYNSGAGIMNQHLQYALNGSTNINKFIIDNLKRIGTIRGEAAGDKAGTQITALDMQKYFDQLGLDDKLIKNTVASQAALELATTETGKSLIDNSDLLDENSDYLKKNASSIIKNSETLSRLYDSNGNLKVALDGLPKTFGEMMTTFGEYMKEVADSIASAGSSSGPADVNSSLEAAGDAFNAAMNELNKNQGGNSKPNYDSMPAKNPNRPYTPNAPSYGKMSSALKYAVDVFSEGLTGAEGVYELVRGTVARTDKPIADLKKYLVQTLGINESYVKWVANYIGREGFAKGGVVDYTGLANVHGSRLSSEVVFNAADAKKLYDLVHNLDLTTLSLPRIATYDLSRALGNVASKHEMLSIDQIVMNFPKVNDPEGVRDAILNLNRDIRLYTK